jgi:hypothetical protein
VGVAGLSGDRELVVTERLDDALARLEISASEVSVLWIDVQGAELKVLQSAEGTLAAGVPVVMEYTPSWLASNGDLEAVEALIARNFTRAIDIRNDVEVPAHDLPTLRSQFVTGEFTDLVLL